MSVERNGNFITLSAGGDSIKVPFAAYESGKQIIATVVDQARTADGIVRGSVIAKASKIELKWAVLTPEVWVRYAPSSISTFTSTQDITICRRTLLQRRKCMSVIDQHSRSRWIV